MEKQLAFAGHPKALLVWHQYVLGSFMRHLNLTVCWPTQLIDSALYLVKHPCDLLFYKSATANQIRENMVGFTFTETPVICW